MRDYFIGLAAAAVISAVCAAFASGTALERYVRYMCSLVCLAAVVLPLVKAIPDAVPEYDLPSAAAATAEDAGGYFENAARALTEEYIKRLSYEKTGIQTGPRDRGGRDNGLRFKSRFRPRFRAESRARTRARDGCRRGGGGRCRLRMTKKKK